MTILWVEDQLEDNRSVHDRLTKRGAVVRLASDVEQALALLESESFDVIVVDLNIPIGPGPLSEKLRDGNYNGEYVVVAAVEKTKSRILCLTNFWEDARLRLPQQRVTVLPKTLYLAQIESEIHGG